MPREHMGESKPTLAGKYLKFLLAQPPVDFLAPDEVPAATRNTREPYVLMHMRKPLEQTRVVVPVPTTAVDEAHTPVDALPPGTLAAGSEITPERPESPDEVTGLIERLRLPGEDTSAEGGPMLARGARCEITGLVAAAQHNGKRCSLTEFHEARGRWQVP